MNAAKWKFQFGLGWAAYGILVCAVGLGWYRAHTQAAHDLERLPTDVVVMDKQVKALTQQIERDGYFRSQLHRRVRSEHFAAPARYTVTVPETADAFMQQLEAIRQDSRPFPYNLEVMFRIHLFQLYQAPDGMFHEAVPAVIRFTQVPESPVRQAAVRLLHGLVLQQELRMTPHLSALVDALAERLGDADDRVRIDAIQTLESIGPEASSALERLEEIEADSDDPAAVFAALAIDAIDPQYDAVPRLQELIEQRRSEWQFAAEYLPEIVPPKDAERYFIRQIMNATAAEDIELFARILSKLGRQRMFSEQETSP